LGQDKIEVEVIPFEKEYLRLGLNSELLEQLANNSGGIFTDPEQLEGLFAQLEHKPRFSRIEKDLEMWYRPVLLFIILFSITLEWILRKRFGLV